MAEFTVEEICLATGGNLVNSIRLVNFTGVSTDTRTVKQGDLFIPLVGENFDGHDFIEQAIKNGASGVIFSRKNMLISKEITAIEVEDTLLALQNLARFHRQRFTIPVVAITGSNGKTTTKDMAAAVLSSKFHVLKTEANYNNEIGLPLTLLQLTKQHEVAVVEMGMRGKGQIRQLANIALPTIAIITNIGETHLELLGSIENIASAKAELLEFIPKSGLSLLNADNSYVKKMSKQVNSRVQFFGLEQGDIKAENIQMGTQNMKFSCRFAHHEFPVEIPAIGKHNVYNGLAAIALGLELGLNVEEICAGFKNFNASPMRLHIEKLSDYLVINDAYNASPMSMVAAIDTLVEVAKGRKVAVLGDMLELGPVAIEAHGNIGDRLAFCQVDIVVTVGELATNIARRASACGIKKVVACANHKEAQEALQKLIEPGDTILVKGSRGMKMENIIKMFS
ncbi:UDP-N-acetylmuramoyl-tripeptide--D-alanyl-D-alanine ligase [Pelosinus sp. IPA-1]|uniref:UDP-N-acetylmuramoyl-tripeptide--D-alanyl-D- alanine ligase n=1 Tax=Pelosinus sp. IPA-1 TaxID=3029569 RepID=UPI0024362187|nr:UDP-N-acetylmuramoyl-tripeptide--D-alanyl-D-alanine ligase [Pelosinus sp. IPA-1]GMA99702.1 UDP-N-acetylmuramoyl-tripeptide--D-alanyl-D-alanine ligase [Pelosinus sp. IPA-1]